MKKSSLKTKATGGGWEQPEAPDPEGQPDRFQVYEPECNLCIAANPTGLLETSGPVRWVEAPSPGPFGDSGPPRLPRGGLLEMPADRLTPREKQ